MSKPTAIVFDLSNAAHRISSVMPPLTAGSGQRTEVMFGLLRLLVAVMKGNTATTCYLCWDGKGSRSMRQKIDPLYKSRRDSSRTEEVKERMIHMYAQVESFWELFGQHLPIAWLSSTRFEADDLMSMVTHEHCKVGDDVVLVTGDNDLLQLVSKQVSVYIPHKNAYCTPENFSKFAKGYPNGRAWLDAKVLMGESPDADNIPGIRGCGEVTAMNLLASHQFSLAELLTNPSEQMRNSKVGKAVLCDTGRARLKMNYRLMSLLGPLHQTLATKNVESKTGTLNTARLRENMSKMRFATLIASFNQFIKPFQELS